MVPPLQQRLKQPRGVNRLQSLLTGIHWDEGALNTQRVEQLRGEVRLGEGVLIIDDTGFPKQGNGSVGVARQYCGELGKVDNCQVCVTCHYADSAVSWPVNARLYLPQEWTDAPQRKKQAGVPHRSPVAPNRKVPWSC